MVAQTWEDDVDQFEHNVEEFAREVAFRLSAARQTNSLNSGWHDIEKVGRALFSLSPKERET